MRHRDRERGVVLINVLVILALASAVLIAMMRLSDTAITRSQRYTDAGQGLALIAGGEATAIAALRRDPREADHPGEAWAVIAQDQVAVEGGTFSLVIADAQGRFNLNSLAAGDTESAAILQRILAELELPETVGLRIAARLVDPTPLPSLDALVDAGIPDDQVAVLAKLVTALPGVTPINLNTMPDAMFAILADNPVQARLLQGMRARAGQLTPQQVLDAGLILTATTGFTSSYFTVTTEVAIGDTVQRRESLIHRAGRGDPLVIARRIP
jgi:general secretion pathway protein K